MPFRQLKSLILGKPQGSGLATSQNSGSNHANAQRPEAAASLKKHASFLASFPRLVKAISAHFKFSDRLVQSPCSDPSVLEFSAAPSFATLPPELLMLMIPDPAELHGVRVDDDSVTTQGWLAIKYDWRRIAYTVSHGYHRTSGPHYSLQTLRALSQTCKRLRALALPLLWSVVHVKTVEELGRLRIVLREAPYVVPLIGHFSFVWDMNEDYHNCHCYSKDSHGTLLDLAFIDRGALWERTHRQQGSPRISYERRQHVFRSAYFLKDYLEYHEPGHEPLPENLHVDEEDFEHMSSAKRNALATLQSKRRSDLFRLDLPRGLNPDRSGPDGNGIDRRIKSPRSLKVCLADIAAKLSSLEVFVWATPVMQIHPSVLQSLKRAKNLKSMHITIRDGRNLNRIAQIFVFIPLLQQVSSLSFETRSLFRPITTFVRDYRRQLAETDEVTEQDPAWVDGTRAPPSKILGAYYSVIYRSISAAARTGNLRRLILPELGIQQPFAVRALVPFWVWMEEWYVMNPEIRPSAFPKKIWSDAAAALRPALAHASFWLPRRDSRKLTGGEVQSLHEWFHATPNVPDFTGEQQVYYAHRKSCPSSRPSYRFSRFGGSQQLPAQVPVKGSSLVNLYLPWLMEDAELAQQVAGAWNAIVERKEADKVKCRCEQCNQLFDHQVQCHCEQCYTNAVKERERATELHCSTV